MRERRFLVPEIDSAREVDIDGAEAHHLLHVLRLQVGDEIVLFDGRGMEYRAVLTRCERSSATARPLEPLTSRESPLKLTLAVAVPKMDSMARIVREITELGAHRLIPLRTARTVVGPSQATRQLARWRRIAEEACKQSGRGVVPIIEKPLAFQELLEAHLPVRRFLFTVGGPSLREQDRPPSCLAAVGPEGGWTNEEVASALAKGFQPLGLGTRTLRTETAALAAVAVLEWLWGDARSL